MSQRGTRERRPRAGAAQDLAGSSIEDESTARPQAVTLIGADALHRLTAAGYRVAGVCCSCGAPLVAPKSVARGLGPVCSARLGGGQ